MIYHHLTHPFMLCVSFHLWTVPRQIIPMLSANPLYLHMMDAACSLKGKICLLSFSGNASRFLLTGTLSHPQVLVVLSPHHHHLPPHHQHHSMVVPLVLVLVLNWIHTCSIVCLTMIYGQKSHVIMVSLSKRYVMNSSIWVLNWASQKPQ